MKEKLKRSLSSFLVLCMLTTLFPLNIFAASFDIKIHVYDGATNKVISNVGTATVNYTDTEYIQSQDWEIPELNQFTNNSYGRVEKVTGNWYFPSSQASVGSTVTWSINTESKSIYYYVSNYQPGTGIGSATTETTTYPITITQPNNGTITSNVSNAIEGATVVITASPDSGYYFTNLSVKKTNNQEVSLVSNGGNQYTFVMPSEGVTVTGTTTFRGNNNSGDNSDYSSSTYRIHIQKIDNGIVDSNKVLSHIGETVELTITPGKEYELESLTVLKGNNTEVKLTKKSKNKYTFIMPGIDVYVYSSFKKTSNRIDAHDCDRGPDCPMWGYNDLNPYEWYHDGVHHCIADGIMIGYGDATFKPNASITRAMIVTMLWRLENSPVLNYLLTYDDIEYEAWYTEGLRWATSEKIVAGYGNNKFGPNDVLTREQMVAVLWRYAKYKGYDVSVGENTNILSYNDVFDVSEYAIPAMQWACGTGIIIGNNGYLMPKDATTRAQTATIFYRYLMNI